MFESAEKARRSLFFARCEAGRFQRPAMAVEEAGMAGPKETGPGRLALGLLREEACEAAEILRAQGLSLDRVRRSVAASLGYGEESEGRNYV